MYPLPPFLPPGMLRCPGTPPWSPPCVAPKASAATLLPLLAVRVPTTPSPLRHITAAAAGKLLPPLELAHGLAELIPFHSMLILPSSSLYIVTTDPSLLTQGRRPL